MYVFDVVLAVSYDWRTDMRCTLALEKVCKPECRSRHLAILRDRRAHGGALITTRAERAPSKESGMTQLKKHPQTSRFFSESALHAVTFEPLPGVSPDL